MVSLHLGGICRHLGDKKVGIIHFDRHVDTQETDLDERMHTCPWFHATNIKNAPAKNLVQWELVVGKYLVKE